MAGREILAKRDQLRAFGKSSVEPFAYKSANHDHDPSKYQVTNTYQVTSELVQNLPLGTLNGCHMPSSGMESDSSDTSSNLKSYTVDISARASLPRNPPSAQHKHRAKMEANRAAFGYAKVACLFFISLLVTWVPSSINRVYSLVHPNDVNVKYAYAAGLVLSLMGFWNSVIYIATSHRACNILFSRLIRKGDATELATDLGEGRGLGNGRGVRGSSGDSLEGLAGQREWV